MIFGIGCDICAVARMQKAIEKGSGACFLQRVFSAQECAQFDIVIVSGSGGEATSVTEENKCGVPSIVPISTAKLSASCATTINFPSKTIESLAANFAAKEAFLKATGKGLSGFALADIAALRKESGAPYYVFTGSAAEYMAAHKLTAHLSLTHEKGTAGIAMAYCILECNE